MLVDGKPYIKDTDIVKLIYEGVKCLDLEDRMICVK